MKVIVTGHKGYIGTILVQKLIKKGYEVCGIDIGLYNEFTYVYESPKITEIQKDIRDINIEDIQGYDAIIHLAALSNDPLGDLNPGLTDSINFKASAKLADMAKKAGIKRFIFSSSCSVYGRIEKEEEITELDPTGPITEYAISKQKLEEHLSKLADDTFTPVMMRNSTVYGFSPSLRMDLVVNGLSAWGYYTGKINILSDGRPWRPLIHVQDLSDMFITMIEAPKEKVHNQIFNVGFKGENYQIKDIAEIVKKVIPGTEITIAMEFDPDSRSYKVNFDKLEKTLGVKNNWNVEKGVKEMYEFYKKGLMSEEDFKNNKHARLRQLKVYEKEHSEFFTL